MTKTCSRCKVEKEINKFSFDNYTGYYNSWCKNCASDYSREWRQNNKDKKRAMDKRYYEKHKEQALENCYRRRRENPLLKRCQSKVYRAIRSGRLLRAKICQHCFTVKETIAHHEDYTKPLDVLWVCHKCHANIHDRGLKKVS